MTLTFLDASVLILASRAQEGLSRRALDLMIAESRAIVAERDDLGTALPAPEIAKRLIRATVAPVKSSNSDAEVRGANGKVILRYAHSARGGHTFKVPARSGASTAEVLKAIESVLQKS